MSRPAHPNRLLSSMFIAVFVANQFLIMGIAHHLGAASPVAGVGALFGIRSAQAMEILMPIPNEDGKTTHLQMMPTITPVPGEPTTDDAVVAAKTVMLATGTPFYAPEGISFDDPVGSLAEWGTREGMTLTPEQETRYQGMIGVFPCNFCCGDPRQVTINNRCGCAHAIAARGFFRYMLATYGDTYSNEQLVGEAYRWQAIWYPSGVVEDYLLATGRGNVIGHKTHGGAGADGMHGYDKS